MTRDVSGRENIADSLEYMSSSPQEILADLARRGFTEVVIGGGAEIYSMFLREKLVTDLYLTVEPVVFGDGVPLVTGGVFQKLNLVSSERLGERAILLHYAVV
jgi:riboflavin biosynthesis pyrimidine reductase